MFYYDYISLLSNLIESLVLIKNDELISHDIPGSTMFYETRIMLYPVMLILPVIHNIIVCI